MAINLQKGQKISLSKDENGNARTLTAVTMGLGWDAATGLFGMGGGNIDLDASCVMLDANNNEVDSVWFGQLRSKDGSIRHTGDNLTGDGDGDDEQIIIDLTKVPANVDKLVLVIASYRGQTFDKVKNAFCRVVNNSDKKEIAKYDLSFDKKCSAQTGQVMVKLYRHNGEWKMAAIGEGGNGRTYKDLLPLIKNLA
jgi:tellurium resistance protein TerZ